MDEHDPTKRPESVLDRLMALDDVEAIRTLKSRYAIGADRCLTTPSAENAAALAEFFTHDAVAEFGPFGRFEGRAQLIHAFEVVLPGAVCWSQHYIVNPVIEVRGGTATGSWYFLVHAVPKGAPAGTVVHFYGSYEDRYLKTSSGWRYASLRANFIEPPK